MRDFAFVICMLLAAVVGMAVAIGAATGYWHLAAVLGGYGALTVAVAGTVWAAMWAGVVHSVRAVRCLLDRRANG